MNTAISCGKKKQNPTNIKRANPVTEKDIVYYQKKKKSIISTMAFDRLGDPHTSEIKSGTKGKIVRMGSGYDRS